MVKIYREEVIIINNRGLDFKHKEVININDARRLGYVQDVTADLKTGTITSIIVPGNSNKIFGFFSGRKRHHDSLGKHNLYPAKI